MEWKLQNNSQIASANESVVIFEAGTEIDSDKV